MDQATIYWVAIGLAFVSVALVAFGAASYALERGRVRQRYEATANAASLGPRHRDQLGDAIRSKLNVDRIGISAAEQKKYRQDLIKAGFFSPNAVANFTVVRLLMAIIFPAAAYFLLQSTIEPWATEYKFLALAAIFLLAYFLPTAYLSRRKRNMQESYRLLFPDLLDLLVVCVDAGLSLEAALARVTTELATTHPALQTNLSIMAGEMRAGRGTIEALRNFAERLDLDDARSLTVLLQQSLELGTDISMALGTYSEEMRDKRASRAEQKAYALPVKLTLPLGLFIFPVIMLVVLTPMIIRFSQAFSRM